MNVVLGRIAMRLYGEHFVVLQNAISDLGATVTRGGLPNRRSPYVFFVQMVTSGVLCLRYARRIALACGDPRASRARLLRLASAGFFLMPAPHNLLATHYIHMLGGGLIFFSLWVLAMLYLVEARRRGLGGTFWFGMAVLQSGVLTYAFLFAVNSDYKQVAQGFGLLGLIGALVWATVALGHSVPAECFAPDSSTAAAHSRTPTTT